jgi:hypothetical protein
MTQYARYSYTYILYTCVHLSYAQYVHTSVGWTPLVWIILTSKRVRARAYGRRKWLGQNSYVVCIIIINSRAVAALATGDNRTPTRWHYYPFVDYCSYYNMHCVPCATCGAIANFLFWIWRPNDYCAFPVHACACIKQMHVSRSMGHW